MGTGSLETSPEPSRVRSLDDRLPSDGSGSKALLLGGLELAGIPNSYRSIVLGRKRRYLQLLLVGLTLLALAIAGVVLVTAGWWVPSPTAGGLLFAFFFLSTLVFATGASLLRRPVSTYALLRVGSRPLASASSTIRPRRSDVGSATRGPRHRWAGRICSISRDCRPSSARRMGWG